MKTSRIVVKTNLNEFACALFWRIQDTIICFRDYLTFSKYWILTKGWIINLCTKYLTCNRLKFQVSMNCCHRQFKTENLLCTYFLTKSCFLWSRKKLHTSHPRCITTLFESENERQKIEPVPLPLPRASRNFPDVKTRNDFFFHNWTSEIILFIRFGMQMDGT